MYPAHSKSENLVAFISFCQAYWLGRSRFGRSTWILQRFDRTPGRRGVDSLISPPPADWWSERGAGVRGASPLIKTYGKLIFLCLSCPACGNICISDDEGLGMAVGSWLLLHHPRLAVLTSCSALGKPALLGEKSYLFSYPALFTVFPEKRLSIRLNWTKSCVADWYRSAVCSRLKGVPQKRALVLGLQTRTQTTFQRELSKRYQILGVTRKRGNCSHILGSFFTETFSFFFFWLCYTAFLLSVDIIQSLCSARNKTWNSWLIYASS